MHFTELIDLAAERLGGAVLAANDEFFAPKENLIRAADPVSNAGRFTDRGQWMDGWETRRRRTPGHDWCIVKLGYPGVIGGVLVDTTHFKGNYPSHCSIEACQVHGHPSVEELNGWTEILPRSELQGDVQNSFRIENPKRFTHVRFNIYPDGGVARLRIYGQVVPEWRHIDPEIDLAAVKNGGLVIACSDMYFGSRQNLIMPGRGANVADGWETRRRRGPGHDWCIIKLAGAGMIRRLEVDTSHFKGNYPESCSVEAGDGTNFREILPHTKLRPHTRHFFEEEVQHAGPATHVRFNIYPDGGVSRFRVFGMLHPPALDCLNAISAAEAQRRLLECCGSSEWAARMVARRPFHGIYEFRSAADSIWWDLAPEDWEQAFAASGITGTDRRAAAEEQRRLILARLERFLAS